MAWAGLRAHASARRESSSHTLPRGMGMVGASGAYSGGGVRWLMANRDARPCARVGPATGGLGPNASRPIVRQARAPGRAIARPSPREARNTKRGAGAAAGALEKRRVKKTRARYSTKTPKVVSTNVPRANAGKARTATMTRMTLTTMRHESYRHHHHHHHQLQCRRLLTACDLPAPPGCEALAGRLALAAFSTARRSPATQDWPPGTCRGFAGGVPLAACNLP